MTKPILMLEGFFSEDDLAPLHKYALTPVIHNPEQVEILKRSKLGGEIAVYLKVNSGMNRLGFGVEGLRPAYNALRCHPQVKGLTLMTHFADADGAGGIKAQLDWFNELAKPLQAGSAQLSPIRPPCCASRTRSATGCARASCSMAARRSPTRAPSSSV